MRIVNGGAGAVLVLVLVQVLVLVLVLVLMVLPSGGSGGIAKGMNRASGQGAVTAAITGGHGHGASQGEAVVATTRRGRSHGTVMYRKKSSPSVPAFHSNCIGIEEGWKQRRQLFCPLLVGTKTLFQLPPIIQYYCTYNMPSFVMMSTAYCTV